MVFLDERVPGPGSRRHFVFASLRRWPCGLLAYVFGFFAFRSRIRGVYFSIITQAFTFALMLLFFRNETALGGNNGLTNFKQLYGYPLAEPSTKLALYVFSALGLMLAFLLCRFVVASKAGRCLRIRDAESRVCRRYIDGFKLSCTRCPR